jgi:hypothetical protein
MAVHHWTIPGALTFARGIMSSRVLDPRITPAEQSACAALAEECDQTLKKLRPDDTIAPGQRQARADAIRSATTAVSDYIRNGDPGNGFDVDLSW